MTNIEYENNRLLDVVNSDDGVIDFKSRQEVHARGLLHREVHVWMFDKDKNIIFQKRGLHRPSAGLLDATAGGHVNKNEDYLDAALREAREETGIRVVPADLILLRKFKKINRTLRIDFWNQVNNFFRAVYVYKQPVDLESVKREVDIPGGGFQKISHLFFINRRNNEKLFSKFILTEELPHVLDYIK